MKRVFNKLNIKSLATSFTGVALVLAGLVSCNTSSVSSGPTSSTQTSSSSSSSSSSTPVTPMLNLKESLLKLDDSKNYTITYQGTKRVDHKYFFTENSISRYSESYPSYTNSYYYDGLGTYEITYDNEHLVGSEHRSKTNPWDSGLVSTLRHIDTKYLLNLDDNCGESIKITSKRYRIGFLQFLGYKVSDFVNLDYLKATILDFDKIQFDLSYEKVVYTYIVDDFDVTTDLVVQSYINNGGSLFKPSGDLTTAKQLMKSNNYCQKIYNIGEDEESTGYVGEYRFTDSYFYYYYYGTFEYYGYMEINFVEDGEKFYGLYSMYLGATTGQFGFGSAVSEINDVVYVLNYPGNMILWDNLQYVYKYDANVCPEIAELSDGGANAYYITNSTVLSDISYNFNMDGVADGQTPVMTVIDLVKEEGEITQVVFYYYFYYAGAFYMMPFPFFGFGDANFWFFDFYARALNR